ncbi:reverse transcriptase domain-containing protein [Tanacetum coccineum]
MLSGLLPKDPKEARKVQIRAPQYRLIKGNLYKKSFITSWLRCIGSSQAKTLFKKYMRVPCGFNANLRSCLNYTSMYRDAAETIQDCTRCQTYSTAARMPNNDITMVNNTWPFSHWGINIVRPLLTDPESLKFFAIAVKHFTKWVEAKPLTTANGRHA